MKSQDSDTPQPEWIIFFMANYIYNNYEQFMSANDGQVGTVLSNDNTLCKMMKEQYTDLNDTCVQSMSLALLLYLYMTTIDPSLMNSDDNMEIGSVD